MANDMYTDLLRQTREEIARRGTQELEKERNRRQRPVARNVANSGIRGAYGVLSFENGAEIQERNRANRYISEYRNLQNAYGQSGTEADESILQQMKQLNQKYGFSGIQDAENKLEGLEAGKWMEGRNQLYSNLESNPDFEQYSKPSSTTPTAGFGIQFGKHWLGKGDAKYDYINNLGGAQELAAEARGQEDNVNPYGMYDLMEPEEVARYNYLYHTQGEKAADEYLDYLEYILSERGARKVQQVHTALAEGHPILANGLSVFSKLQSGVGLLDVAAQKAGNSIASAITGEEQKPIDYYRAAAPSIATSAIRGTTAQQIADKTGVIHFDEKEHPVLSRVLNGKGLADVYQLGMSMVDSLAAGKLAPGLGKAGTFLLGGSAGTQGMLDAVENGATDDQAIMMGLLNGAAEIVFETYEVENLLGSSSNILKSVLNQALTEAIGESATTISNNLADILVMQDKSEFMRAVQEYRNQGLSKEQAQLAAFRDAAIAVGWDAFGGALSGGIFGLAGPKVSGANDANRNGNVTRNSDFTIEEGTGNGHVTRVPETGSEARQAPQGPNGSQPQQMPAGQAAQASEAGSGAVSGAVEYYKENGRVSNSLAEKVLADPAAVQELQERTGVTIPGTMEGATHTQKRNAVKSAIAQLAGERPGLSRQGAVDTFVDSIQELREENNGTEAAPEQAGGAPPAELDAAISQALRGERPGNSVDSVQPGQYNNKRSDQVSGVIDRLNRGGTDSPSIDEIMAIPEIAEAEKSNDGTETINLPDREQIRNAGYQQAMQKGSWNGTDYSGPVRQERRMDIVIGLPGSGKSSVYTERLSQQYGSRVIDTDDFREYIPEYNGSNASVVHEEASEIRDMVFEAALGKGDNVLLSTIGANANKLEGQIARYRQLGYSVYLHLNELPNSKSIARAIGRYISEDGSLGRYVSPKLIEAYGDKPTQTYLYLTGQGGTENGGLGSDLRTGRGQSSENAGQNAGTQEGSAAGGGEGLLAGYDWYNNDVARGERPRLVQSSEQNPGIKGTGAAERNFSGKADYQNLLYEGNVQRDRPGDVRPVEVPKTNAEGKKVSEFAGNAYGAEVTPDAMASEIESLIQDGYLSYDTRTNRESLENARDYIYGKDGNPGRGEAETRHQIQRNVDKGRIQDGDIEKAMLLYAKYANRKSKTSMDNASSMMVMLQEMATMSGRNLQLFSMFQKMTPEGQLMTVKKTAQRAVDNMVRRGRAKKGSEANIPKQLEAQYLEESENEKSPEKALTAGAANMIQEASSQIVQASASDAVESAVNNALAPYSEQSNESWRNGSESGNANIQTNDMAERVGQRVANNLQAEARSSNQSVEDILYREIMRFAEDKARAGRQKTTRIEGQNLDALRDYYRYRPFFQTAWDTARARVQQAMNNMREGDARIPVIEQFLASGDEFLGIENESPVTGLDRSNPASTLRRGTKEAAAKAGIRMENRKPGNVQRAKNQLRDVLLENWQSKQAAAEQIASIAMEGMNLSEEASAKMAGDIMAAFYADLADQSARKLSNMFKDGKTAKKVHDTLAQRLEKLYNMGAFANSDYRQAAFESVFGQEGIDVPDGLLEEFVESAGDRKASIEQQIYMVVGSQIEATFLQKWNTLRYMAMMGNLRTNERNIAGNIGYIPYKTAKDIFGSALELVLPKNQRTKSILNPLSSSDKALIAWAKADAKSKPVQDALRYSAKVSDDVSTDIIQENQRIFKWDGLENYRKLVEWAPSAGDMLFKNPYYTNSLAGFLKARGYTAENLQNGSAPDSVIQEARTYAIEEAMKATFNDRNAFSDAVSNLRYYGDNPFLRAASLLGEGIMPFRRTPANIVARIVDNSPVSIARGFIELGTKVRKGQMSAATAIDHISSGLTGTGMTLLGYTLASGIFGVRLRGKVDDEDKKRRGYQSWALEIFRDGEWKSYSIEWAAPENIPLFIGANLYQEFNEREYDTSISSFSKFLYACGSAFEPMLALSCLSSLSDAFNSVKYAEDGQAPFAFVAQAAFSYLTQAFPSMWRQGINAAHEVKHETFANNQDPILRELERFAGRIPGVGELFHTKSIDEWGRETSNGGVAWRILDNFINPGKLSAIDNSDLETEVERLNGTQPENVSPRKAAKTITYTDADGNRHENYRLTEEEYNTLQTVQGQTAYDILNEIISSDSYDNLTDDQKARAFGYIYDYARERGRMAAIDGYEGNLANWMKDIEGNEAGAVFRKIISADFTDSFDAVIKGADGASDSLQRAYDSYYDLPPQEQKAFLEDAEGRVKYMIHAGDAGMSAETFASMYQTYRSIDKRDLSISQKANQWSYELQRAYERGDITKKQMQTLKKDMVFRYSGVVDTPKFDSMVEAGISGGDAKKVVDLLAGLKPESRYKSVRDIQNAEAIINSGLSNGDTVEAMYAYLPSAQDENLREMLDMGFSAQDYVAAWRLYDSESGEGKKRRTIDSYRSMFDVDYETAKMIYEIYG